MTKPNVIAMRLLLFGSSKEYPTLAPDLEHLVCSQLTAVAVFFLGVKKCVCFLHLLAQRQLSKKKIIPLYLTCLAHTARSLFNLSLSKTKTNRNLLKNTRNSYCVLHVQAVSVSDIKVHCDNMILKKKKRFNRGDLHLFLNMNYC